MTTSRRQIGSDHRAPSANDRLKAGWSRHVALSTTVAVLAHGALLLFLPGWVAVRAAVQTQRWEGTPLLALPEIAGLPEDGPAPAAPVLALGDEEGDDDEDGLVDGASLDEADVVAADLWDAIGERLRRRGALVPAITEPETAVETDEVDGEGTDAEEDDPSIGGDAVTTDLQDLPAPSSMDLDRLATIEPELALQSASAWVLLRNPVEVETYLRRGYRLGRLDPDVRGSVSVTLWIDQRGSVQWAEVSESSGRRELDEYALALFNEVAAFKAAREGGVSVSRSVTLSVNFPW